MIWAPHIRKNGNTTTDDLGRTMIYDAWNHLVTVTEGTITLANYAYDGLGRRISEAAGGGGYATDIYYSTQSQDIEEDDSFGGPYLVAQYVWSPVYVNALVLRDYRFSSDAFTLTDRTYGLQDVNFNTTALVSAFTELGDSDGDGHVDIQDLNVVDTHWQHSVIGGDAEGDFNLDGFVDSEDLNYIDAPWQSNSTSVTWSVQSRFVYDPYGNFNTYDGSWTSNTNYLAWNVTFQGGMQDPVTGNIHFDNRDYNPRTMTWNTKDPLGYVDGMNTYQMVRDNPLSRLDPTGFDSFKGFAEELPKTIGGWRHYVFGVAYEYDVTVMDDNGWDFHTVHKSDIVRIYRAAVCPTLAHDHRYGLGAWLDLAQYNADGLNDIMKADGNVRAWEATIGVLAAVDGAILLGGAAWLAAPSVAALVAATPEYIMAVGTAASTQAQVFANFLQQMLGELEEAGFGGGCFREGTQVLCSSGTRTIESLTIGQRVLTGVKDDAKSLINPADYRMIRLQFARPGQEFHLAFLRPAKRFEGLGAGDLIDLSVLELKISGRARVLSIEPCPPIEEACGRVVTGAFTSQSVDVRLLKLEGLEEPIEVTGNHPVFSEDQKRFVTVSTLSRGERLRTREGMAVVESVNSLGGNWDVFNLETEEAHQYYVSKKLLLVHNANGVLPSGADPQLVAQAEALYETFVQQLSVAMNSGDSDGPETQRILQLMGQLNDLIGQARFDPGSN